MLKYEWWDYTRILFSSLCLPEFSNISIMNLCFIIYWSWTWKLQKNNSEPLSLAGVSNLLMSLGHSGRRVVLGQTLNTQTLMKTKKSYNVLNKFMILCCAAFIAILSHRLDTPVRASNWLVKWKVLWAIAQANHPVTKCLLPPPF